MIINKAINSIMLNSDVKVFYINNRCFDCNFNLGYYIRECNKSYYYEFFIVNGFDSDWINKNKINYERNECEKHVSPEFSYDDFKIYMSLMFKELIIKGFKITIDGELIELNKLKHSNIE